MRFGRRSWLLLLVSAAIVAGFVLGSDLVPWGPSDPVPENTTSTRVETVDFPWREAMFYEQLADDKVQCNLCFRECVIPEGERGFCRNRENIEGSLFSVVWGRPSAVHVDPIEKEPLHQFLPGTKIYCIGTAGCNFRCSFCHNWTLSQRSVEEIGYYPNSTPREVVNTVKERGVPTISFTYNEPTSAYEYLYDVAKKAQEAGINVVFHSNGSMSPEPLRELLQYVDAVTIDLKGFTERYYNEILGASLEPVLETLKIIREEGVWLEIVNLVVPEENDDPEEIRAMCHWIVENLGTDVPLHFSRFFPNYQMTHAAPTPISTLEGARDVAKQSGIQYVTIGNVPGHPSNSTECPDCGETLIERVHFSVHDVNIENGQCTHCGHEVSGVFQ